MADPINQQPTTDTQSYFDPVGEARKGPLDVSQFDDKTLFTHLNDPNKFRQAIPDYAHLSDDEIKSGMQKSALRRPDLSPPPPAAQGVSAPSDSLDTQRPNEMHGVDVAEGKPVYQKGPSEPDYPDQGMRTYRNVRKAFGIASTVAGAPLLEAGPAIAIPALIRGALGATVGSYGGKKIAEKLGGDEDTQEISGDVGGLAGGVLGNVGKSSFGPPTPKQTPDPALALTSALTKNPKVDVYGNAKVAVPSLQAAFDASGHDVNNMPKGIEGLLEHAKIAKHAIDTHEANFDRVLDSVRHEPLSANQLQHMQTNTPDLLSHLQEIAPNRPPTLNDVNQARLDSNVAPGVGQNYRRPETIQPSAPEKVKDWNAIGNQARKVLYPAVQDGTGVDVGKIKANEAALLHLKDTINLTQNLTEKPEADFRINPAAKIREPFSGGVPSKKDVANRVMGAVMDKVRPPDSPADIFNKKMALVYGAPRQDNPLTAPTITPRRNSQSPNASGLNRIPTANPGQASDALSALPQPNPATALERVKTSYNPADELAKAGQKPAPDATSLYQGGTRVPTPIRNAMTSLPTTQPTGRELTEPPFSYPPSPGSELGDLSDREITSGGKGAVNRFYRSNPDPLGKIPVKIEKAVESKSTPETKTSTTDKTKKAPPTEQDKKVAEYEALKKMLANLMKGEK